MWWNCKLLLVLYNSSTYCSLYLIGRKYKMVIKSVLQILVFFLLTISFQFKLIWGREGQRIHVTRTLQDNRTTIEKSTLTKVTVSSFPNLESKWEREESQLSAKRPRGCKHHTDKILFELRYKYLAISTTTTLTLQMWLRKLKHYYILYISDFRSHY